MPPSACRNFPIFVAGGSRERTGDVAEQFALEQRIGRRSAGDFHERLVAAAAELVDRPGGDRLSGPGLAEDQHRRPRVRHAFDQVEHLGHLVVAWPMMFEIPNFSIELLLELAVLFHDPLLAHGPPDREVQLVVDDRLGQVVEGPDPDRLRPRFDRPVAGQQNDRRLGLVGDDPLERRENRRRPGG